MSHFLVNLLALNTSIAIQVFSFQCPIENCVVSLWWYSNASIMKNRVCCVFCVSCLNLAWVGGDRPHPGIVWVRGSKDHLNASTALCNKQHLWPLTQGLNCAVTGGGRHFTKGGPRGGQVYEDIVQVVELLRAQNLCLWTAGYVDCVRWVTRKYRGSVCTLTTPCQWWVDTQPYTATHGHYTGSY